MGSVPECAPEMTIAISFVFVRSSEEVVVRKDRSATISSVPYCFFGVTACCPKRKTLSGVVKVGVDERVDMAGYSRTQGNTSTYSYHPYFKLSGEKEKQYWKPTLCGSPQQATGDRMNPAVDEVKRFLSGCSMQGFVPSSKGKDIELGVVPSSSSDPSPPPGTLMNSLRKLRGQVDPLANLSKEDKEMAHTRKTQDLTGLAVLILKHLQKAGPPDGVYSLNIGQNVVADFSSSATLVEVARTAIRTVFRGNHEEIMSPKDGRVVIPWNAVSARVEEELQVALQAAKISSFEKLGFNADAEKQVLKQIISRNEALRETMGMP